MGIGGNQSRPQRWDVVPVHLIWLGILTRMTNPPVKNPVITCFVSKDSAAFYCKLPNDGILRAGLGVRSVDVGSKDAAVKPPRMGSRRPTERTSKTTSATQN